MDEIKIIDIGKLSVNSTPFHDKDEDEDHTREKFSFMAIDTELEIVDRIRKASREGKIVSVTFGLGD
jgi:hypothetical protein